MRVEAETLVRIRAVYGLSQTELAALCNVSVAYINMIERGKRAVPDIIRRKVASEFTRLDEAIEDPVWEALGKAEVARRKIRGADATITD